MVLLLCAGYKVVGDFGAQRWPAARYTLCGDPHNDNRKQFMTAGPIQGEHLHLRKLYRTWHPIIDVPCVEEVAERAGDPQIMGVAAVCV
jgi:hypothetical protein